MPTDRRKFGDSGEYQAAAFLARRGFRVLGRNVRLGRLGEIDIIALDSNGVLVFIEVKTRRDATFGRPEEALTPSKIRTLANCAESWRNLKGWVDRPWRVDVIAIDFSTGKNETRHIENIALE